MSGASLALRLSPLPPASTEAAPPAVAVFTATCLYFFSASSALRMAGELPRVVLFSMKVIVALAASWPILVASAISRSYISRCRREVRAQGPRGLSRPDRCRQAAHEQADRRRQRAWEWEVPAS